MKMAGADGGTGYLKASGRFFGRLGVRRPAASAVLTVCVRQAQRRRVEAAGLPRRRRQADGPVPARAGPTLGLRQGHVGVRRLVENLEVQRERGGGGGFGLTVSQRHLVRRLKLGNIFGLNLFWGVEG